MKRGADDPERATTSKPAKRTKASKACRTCRQQKTRCDPVDTASEAGFRCKRCAHFNLECSFEHSPPRDSVAPTTEPPNAPSVPWGSSPEPSNPENHRQEASKLSASTTPMPYTGFAISPSSYSRVPWSHGPSPSGHPPQSPGRSAKVGSVSGDSTSASLKTKVATGYAKQFYESLRHPVAPPSPPRSADRTDNPVPYEALTTSPAWTPNCGRPITGELLWLTPMLFVRNLLSKNDVEHENSPSASEDLAAQGIVSPEEADALSIIWNRRYVPWLPGGAAGRDSSSGRSASAFLQSAQWMLASRHLQDDAFSSTQEPSTSCTPLPARLANVLDRCTMRAMIGLDQTLPALQALLILASWTGALPAHATNDPGGAQIQTQHLGIAYDGEFFVGAAVNLASRMHLELDVEKALTHGQGSAAGARPPISEQTLERARMMFRVSILSALLNIGKGRPCSTRVPLHQAEKIFGSPSDLAAQPKGIPDAQIVFHCNMLEIALRFMDLTAPANAMHALRAENWMACLQELFTKLGNLQQALLTAVVNPGEVLPFTALTAQLHFVRLLMLCRAFKYVVRSFPKLKPNFLPALMGAVIGSNTPLYPVEPFKLPIILKHMESPHLPVSSDHPSDGDLEELTSKLADAALNWARTAKEANESLMVASLGFQQRHPDHAARGERVLASLAYAPDCMVYALFFGPLFAIKIHLMALSVFNCEASRAEVTRSLLAKLLIMLQEASPTLRAVGLNPRTTAEDSESRANRTDTLPNDPVAETMTTETKPQLADAQHNSNPPPMQSPSIVGRCADILGALLRLWDSQTQHFRDRESRDSPTAARPPPTSSRPDTTGSHVNYWNSEEGLHVLASSLSSLREMGAQHSSVLMQPSVMHMDDAQATEPPAAQLADAGPPTIPSYQTAVNDVSHFAGEFSDLFVSTFGFDASALWYDSFLYGSVDEMN